MYRDHVLKSEVWGYAGGIGLCMHAVAVRMSERRWRGLCMHTVAVRMSERRWRGLYMYTVAVRMSERRWRGLYMHTVAVRMSERRWRGLYMHTVAVRMSDRRWRGLYMHLVKRFAHSGVNTDWLLKCPKAPWMSVERGDVPDFTVTRNSCNGLWFPNTV